MTKKSALLTLLVILIWASNFIAIKIGVSEMEPIALLSLRFLLAGLIFIPFMKWPGWKVAGSIIFTGILMGPLHQGFLFVSLTEMPSGLVSILLQSNVILITLFGWLFLKEDIRWRTWVGICVGLSGIIILVGIPSEATTPIGYFYALMATIFIALNYIFVKRLGKVHPPTYIALMYLPVAPIIMLSSLVIEGTEWMDSIGQLNWSVIAPIIIYQAVILSYSHMIWQKLLADHPMSEIVPWTLLIPVAAVAMAVVILGEELTHAMIFGGTLTIIGVGIVTFRRIEKKYPANTMD